MLSPENVAIPATALTVVVPERVPLPGFEPMASDTEALAAVRVLSETEGILPAIESAHALAAAERWARAHPGGTVLVGLSGRGDKDMQTLLATLLAQPQ